MLTFFHIPDSKQFLKLADESCGEVLLHLPNGCKIDLKRDVHARQTFEIIKYSKTGVRLSFSGQRDTASFIQYIQAL